MELIRALGDASPKVEAFLQQQKDNYPERTLAHARFSSVLQKLQERIAEQERT